MNYSNELSEFTEYLANHTSPNTARVYIYALEQWFKSLNGTKPSRRSAQAYLDNLTKAKKSPSTVSLRGNAIMRWFKYKGTPVSLDCPTIRIGEVEYLIIEQIEKLLASCTTVFEYTLVVVLFDTAVRISELLNLELNDINWDGGFISVIRKGGRREEVNISTKGLDALSNWLDARESDDKRVFMDIPYYTAWLAIKTVGKRAGIAAHPHIFRHSRAVQMLMKGAELHTVKEHLGHTSIATTSNIYGRFKAVHLKKLVPSW